MKKKDENLKKTDRRKMSDKTIYSCSFWIKDRDTYSY